MEPVNLGATPLQTPPPAKPTPPPANSMRILWAVLIVGLFGLGGYSLNRWMKDQEVRNPTQTLPNYGAVPNFSLIDQNNNPVSLANYRGHIWIADLIFTHCAGACPMMTSHMAGLQHSLSKTPQVKMASISIDPKNDSPKQLLGYAKSYNADLSQWSFLTGETKEIYAIAKNGFHLPVDSVGGDQTDPIVHSQRLVLIDAKGNIRGYYDGNSPEVEQQTLMAIGDLLREQKS